MPQCVECGQSVHSLYTVYSPGNIRLTQCESCNTFADKYVEYDGVVIFIDLLLHKHQVYRHILFNRLGYRDDVLQSGTRKLAVILILFEVYLKLVNIELRHGREPNFDLSASVRQWLIQDATPLWSDIVQLPLIPSAIIVSSFGKLLLILMVIWDSRSILEYSWLVSVFVLASNVEALSVIIKSYGAATAITATAAVLKYTAQYIINAAEPRIPMTW
ncbi:sterol homeostasis protein [Sorochytrium milnesiophthora]